MGRFTIGQVVRIKHFIGDLASIICECKEPENHWTVALRERVGDRIQIMQIDEQQLEPYIHFCWFCKADVNSDLDTTCPRCGWVKCPQCGHCEKPACGSNGLLIFKEPRRRILMPEVRKYYEAEVWPYDSVNS